ncbi:MAG TPA: hypothetical protein V6D12_06250 [Candidatus Obscuribacterales bacterium]
MVVGTLQPDGLHRTILLPALLAEVSLDMQQQKAQPEEIEEEHIEEEKED